MRGRASSALARGLTAAALVAGGVPALHAQEGVPIREGLAAERGPYAGLRAGYFEIEGVESGGANFGLVVGYEVHRVFSLEGSIDYHDSSFDYGTRVTWAFQASALLYPFPWLDRFRPYAVAGVGWYVSDIDPSLDYVGPEGSSSDAGYHVGIGFDIRLTRRTAKGEPALLLTFDGRDLYTREEPGNPYVIAPDGLLVTVGFKVRP